MPADETLGRCSRDARLLFVLAITLADDHGRFRSSAAYLRGALFPYDDDLSAAEVERWVQELAEAGRWVLYSERGQRYAAFTWWRRHQRIDNAGRPTWPEPPEGLLPPDPAPELTPVDKPKGNGSKGAPRRTAANRGGLPLEVEVEVEVDQDQEGTTHRAATSMSPHNRNASAARVPGVFLPPGLEQLWRTWPEANRLRFPEAQRHWDAAVRLGVEPQRILAAGEAWVRWWAAEGTPERYVPRPGTWLRDSGWESDPPRVTTPRDDRRAHDRAVLQQFLSKEETT